MRVTAVRLLPRLLALLLLALAGAPVSMSAEAQAPAVYEGVASCAGSTCHGRAEGNGKEVRQDEIAIWQEPSSPSGAHSRAFAVLDSPRGRQIAASLGLGEPTSAGECLGCHATPAAQRGPKFQVSDGVGCEASTARRPHGSPATTAWAEPMRRTSPPGWSRSTSHRCARARASIATSAARPTGSSSLTG